MLGVIGQMASTLQDDGLFILFPEGGNFTPDRWVQGIDRLAERGQHERAEQAARMTHVLAPRSAGTLAALEAAPDIQVVFAAHVGLEDLISLGHIWRRIPLRRRVEAAYWTPTEPVPADHDAKAEWLFRQWAEVDRWIHERSPHVLGAPGPRLNGATMATDVVTDTVIDRPVGVVADYAADPSNAPEWYANIESVEWQTPPPPGTSDPSTRSRPRRPRPDRQARPHTDP